MSQAGLINIESTPIPPGFVLFLEGNDLVKVGPDGTGTINVVGAGAVTVTGNAGTFTETISVTGNGLKWNLISASQTLAVNNGYICVSPGGALNLLLPATSVLGDMIEVTLDGATSWTITQAAGQQIRFANNTTTLGATGTITSTAAGDTLRFVCQTANLKWNVLSAIGNLTVV